EKLLSSIRCKVEHAFHRIKVQFGYKKVRYRGLAKNTARLTMLASIATCSSEIASKIELR
ncbi:transposase, partial [Parasutterella sp.]